MRKTVIFLCFILLMVILFFSGCTNSQIIPTSDIPQTPKIQNVTVFVTPTPSPQTVYVTDTVPVTAQETIYRRVEQSTTNIKMIGNVYGIASTPSSSAGIDRIKFLIGLAPYSPLIDLTTMKIVFSTENSAPKILTWDTRASTTTFTTKLHGYTSVTSLNANDSVEVNFETAQVPANTRITLELKPESGASLSFSKTTPSTIFATNILY